MHRNTFDPKSPNEWVTFSFLSPNCPRSQSDIVEPGPEPSPLGTKAQAPYTTCSMWKEAEMGLMHNAWEDLLGVGMRQWHGFLAWVVDQDLILGSFLVTSGTS